MKTRSFLLLLGLFVLLTRAHAQIDQFNCGTEEESESSGSTSSQNCSFSFTDFRNHHADDMVPQGIDRTLKIKTNVVFVQKDNGEGNFSTSNPDHVEYWDRVFDTMNVQLELLVQQSCTCAVSPVHYTNIHFEFVPQYIELRNSHYWNHRNDADSNILVSTNKSYLLEIHDLAAQLPGYEDGFDFIITTDSMMWKRWNDANGEIPLWDMGYDCIHIPVYTLNGSCVAYSGFPVYDLDWPAVWHAPDKFLIFINAINHVYPYGEQYIEKDIPATARIVLHEYFHYFGLGHPQGTSCPLNIMRPEGSAARTSLSGCQVRTMYETLMTKNLRKYVICEDKLAFSLVVDSDETWAINARIFGDIEIRDSSTLTITCEIAMDPESRIIVGRGSTLIVDGGLITSDCAEKWKGIIVEGDIPGKQANSGKVILRDDATIELANTAVSMYPSHIPWNNGVQEEYFGGIIEAENSTIQNCTRGVEFMKNDSLGVKDSSFFRDVIFENLNYGVTLWADDGVTFDSCVFSDIQKAGIYAYDSEVIVSFNNSFEEVPVGVDLLTTYPRVFSSKIGQAGDVANQFYSNIGVNVQSAGTIEPILIVNNIFTGIESGDKGIHHNGNGLLSIQKNTFSDERKAIEIFEAGNNYNLIKDNEIDDAWVGCHSIRSNLGLRYLDNCFSSNSLIDIAATVGGIFPFQGNLVRGAGNCFTKNQITEMYNSSSDPVYYFIKSSTSQSSCTYPVNLYNVTLYPNALDQSSLNCGTGSNPITTTIELCDIDDSHSISQLIQDRSDLLQAMQQALSNSYDQKNLQQCLEVIESLILSKMLNRDTLSPTTGENNAIDFLFGSGMDFKDSITAYGITLNSGDISRAGNILNSLNPRTTEQSDFISVQYVNLDYLENPAAYELTSTVKDNLYDIGTSDGPYNGYARSLYEILTGERIEVEIPTEWRSGSIENVRREQPNIRLYPNPSIRGDFNFEINFLPEGEFSIQISNVFGLRLYVNQISSDGVYSFSNDDLKPGIYILSIADSNDRVVAVSRIVISN